MKKVLILVMAAVIGASILSLSLSSHPSILFFQVTSLVFGLMVGSFHLLMKHSTYLVNRHLLKQDTSFDITHAIYTFAAYFGASASLATLLGVF